MGISFSSVDSVQGPLSLKGFGIISPELSSQLAYFLSELSIG